MKDPVLVAVSNNGPMLSILVVGPDSIRDAISTIKRRQKRAGIEAAVFKGKSTLTQIVELPIRAAHQAMLAMLKIESRAAREAGLNTSWLDNGRRWSISLNGAPLIRGKTDVAQLETEVHISLEHFELAGAEEVFNSMKEFEKKDRFGSLCEISYSKVEKFLGDHWGRQAKRQS